MNDKERQFVKKVEAELHANIANLADLHYMYGRTKPIGIRFRFTCYKQGKVFGLVRIISYELINLPIWPEIAMRVAEETNRAFDEAN